MTVARDGAAAVEMALANRPDIILMDIQMPVMDGLLAIGEICKDPTVQEVPIIALTALAMHGDRERCLQVGADEYISKPVRLRDLLDMIDKLLPERA